MKPEEAVKRIMAILKKVDSSSGPKAVVRIGMPLWDAISHCYVVVTSLSSERPEYYDMKVRYRPDIDPDDANSRYFRSWQGLELVMPEDVQ